MTSNLPPPPPREGTPDAAEATREVETAMEAMQLGGQQQPAQLDQQQQLPQQDHQQQLPQQDQQQQLPQQDQQQQLPQQDQQQQLPQPQLDQRQQLPQLDEQPLIPQLGQQKEQEQQQQQQQQQHAVPVPAAFEARRTDSGFFLGSSGPANEERAEIEKTWRDSLENPVARDASLPQAGPTPQGPAWPPWHPPPRGDAVDGAVFNLSQSVSSSSVCTSGGDLPAMDGEGPARGEERFPSEEHGGYTLHPRVLRRGDSVGDSDGTACDADDPRLGDLHRAHAAFLGGAWEAKSFKKFANPMDLVNSFKLVENRELERTFRRAKDHFGTGTEQTLFFHGVILDLDQLLLDGFPPDARVRMSKVVYPNFADSVLLLCRAVGLDEKDLVTGGSSYRYTADSWQVIPFCVVDMRAPDIFRLDRCGAATELAARIVGCGGAGKAAGGALSEGFHHMMFSSADTGGDDGGVEQTGSRSCFASTRGARNSRRSRRGSGRLSLDAASCRAGGGGRRSHRRRDIEALFARSRSADLLLVEAAAPAPAAAVAASTLPQTSFSTSATVAASMDEMEEG